MITILNPLCDTADSSDIEEGLATRRLGKTRENVVSDLLIPAFDRPIILKGIFGIFFPSLQSLNRP